MRDMERRMAYNGIFAEDWMPYGPAGGASSSASSSSQQQHQTITQYTHITRIIDMTRSWRDYSYKHHDDELPVVSKIYLGDGSS